ncbi:MAG: clostripain-related cysteine peptidase [Candidatus Wallbacteria bacterium]|nr:clostripain-related cysteine peptidase [Candidatus Wallbacteria bacterium]
MKRAIFPVTLFFLVFLFQQAVFSSDKSWTVMVYSCADNDLQDALLADLNEMEMVGSGDDVNIVVQIDTLTPVRADTSETGWNTCRRYFVKKDEDMQKIGSELIEDIGEVNMGDPQTLMHFIDFCHAKYPAMNYALILENHGDGWRRKSREQQVRGVCYDETSSNDGLTMPELKQALDYGQNVLCGKIKAMDFDACLMAMAEVASQIASAVDFVSFAEEVEPGPGNDYTALLSQISGSTDGAAFTTAVVDTFLAGNGQNNTKSALDLSKLSAIEKAVDDFAVYCRDHIDTVRPSVKSALTQVKRFQIQSYIDLVHMMELMKGDSVEAELSGKIDAVIASVKSGIIKNGNTTNANGLSIWFPEAQADFTAKPDYLALEFTQITAWGEFLGKYLSSPDDTPDDPSPDL